MAALVSEAIRGWGGVLGLAEESTWATAVTPSTHWLPFLANSIAPERTHEVAEYLAAVTSTEGAHVASHSWVTAHDIGGDVDTYLRYDCTAYALLLAHFFGAAPATTGAGPHTHTYQLAAAGLLPGLTGQTIHGQHSSLSVAEVVPGLVASTLEISGNARGPIRSKIGLLGWKSAGFAAASGTTAIEDAEEALGSHAGFVWNSTTYQPNSFSLKVDRGLVRRPNIGNGLYTDKPQPGGRTSIMLSVELDWTTHALETAVEAATQADAVLTLTGSGNNQCVITLDGAKVVKYSRDSGNAGYRKINVDFMGHYVDTTNRGFKLSLRNDNSAAY